MSPFFTGFGLPFLTAPSISTLILCARRIPFPKAVTTYIDLS
jgi:hypothetical protein